MDYRIGKCSQCGAEYKIPASFAHDRARCKQCQGVVNIAPLAAGASAAAAAPATPPPAPPPRPAPAPAAIPARKVVPAPAAQTPPPEPARAEPAKPEPATGGPRKGGTLERLKAERRAAAEAAAAGSAPAQRPAPAPAAGPVAKPGARPAPAAAAPAASRPARSSGRRKSEPAEEKPAKAGGRARRGSASREKKKAPVAGLVSILALVVVGTGVFLFRDSLFGSSETEVAAAGEEAAANDAATPAEATPAPKAATPEPEVVDTPEPEPEAAPEAEAPKAPKSRDPSSIDLSSIPALTKTSDTTAEEWTTMQDQMAQWMDRDAGAAANRSKIALLAQGRKAVPVILNFFKALDLATDDGRSNGDQCQKALQEICNGTNFDWKYADAEAGRPVDHPDDVWFCKRVVELWINSWKQGEENIEAWIRMAKLDEKDPDEAARLREAFGKKTATGESAEPVLDGGDDDLEVD